LMVKMIELGLLPMSLFRDKEDMREEVNYFDLEEKSLGLLEKKLKIRSHGGGKVRKMMLVF
jgi:hypothetical protein